MKTITWGVVGCGDVCERKSGPPLYLVDGCELRACYRRNAELGRDFGSRHGPSEYVESYDDLLSIPEIQAIYVATPHALHAQNTIDAAAAGKHVLCEKPMASDAASCSEMIDSCAKAGVVLGVAYYRRCYPSMLKTFELVRDGAIGELRTVHINDEFPLSHRLDLLHFFCGDIESLSAVVGPLDPGSHAERGAVLHATTVTGVEGVTNVGWQESGAPESLTFKGTTGSISVDDLKGGSLTLSRNGSSERMDFAALPYTHWGLIANFADHLRGEAPLACDGMEGRKSTVILDCIATLVPGAPPVPVDYAHPPPPPDGGPDPALNLLG